LAGEIALTVLLVDDHEGFRSCVRQLLERSEFCWRVREAQSAEECLILVHQEVPDLILMDINLPGQDGLHATSVILKHHPQIPILILTSLEVEEYEEEAKALGALGIISKCDLSVRKLEHVMSDVIHG